MNETTTLLPHIKLRFNVDHPSFEECYAYGYECAVADVSEAENPYRPGSKEHEQWFEGWWAGFYGEIPLYDASFLEEPAELKKPLAANDHSYTEGMSGLIALMLEITGVLAVSAVVGYQVIELVA